MERTGNREIGTRTKVEAAGHGWSGRVAERDKERERAG